LDFWDDTLFHDTVMLVGGYDFWEKQPSPRMRDSEGRLVQWWPLGRGFDVSHETDGYNAAPAMLPTGDDGMYSFETRRRLLPGAGGGWHATALPKPPVGQLAEEEIVFVSAYVAVGTRVWISVTRKGTFSLDTRTGTWTAEGAWQLPFEGRELHVPEIDAVVGLSAGARMLCACDVETGTPPVMRRLWRETLPGPGRSVSLATAAAVRSGLEAKGQARPSVPGQGHVLHLQAYEHGAARWSPYHVRRLLLVGGARSGDWPSGELELVKRGRMSYMCPPRGREWAYIGFIQPAI
jgi:hypothetical protein